MRIWHYKLIPHLPRLQLVAQWRELNSIFAKQDKHILINYVYNYDKEYLFSYTITVISEMVKRGFKIQKWDNFHKYFYKENVYIENLHFHEHNERYLKQCFYNLQEKYDRGQTDFSKEKYLAIKNLCNIKP